MHEAKRFPWFQCDQTKQYTVIWKLEQMNKSDSTHLHNAFVWVGRDLPASMSKSGIINMLLSSEKEL